jgi:peptide/nickel transport system substrate-binding protein
MFSHNKFPVMLSLLLVASFILPACKTETIIETVEVPVEVEVEKPIQVEVLITPTPEPIPQGGSVVFGNILDPDSLNPILAPDNRTVLQLFLPLFRINYFTGEIVGRIAESWSSSEDGLTYTFKLRDDIYWTDGTPLTAWDFKFTYDAYRSEFVEGLSLPQIESINVIDDYSLEIVFNTIHCAYMLYNLLIPPLPSHMYAEDFSDIMDSPLSEAPTVTSGPFKFQEWVKGDHITLIRNENYYLGAPHIERYISLTFEDDESQLAAFLAGEIDVTSVDAEYVSVIEAEIAKGQSFAIHKYLSDGYSFVAFNMANPEKAEIGWEDLDEDGIFDEDEPPISPRNLTPS